MTSPESQDVRGVDIVAVWLRTWGYMGGTDQPTVDHQTPYPRFHSYEYGCVAGHLVKPGHNLWHTDRYPRSR
jgi:hypothetical protein